MFNLANLPDLVILNIICQLRLANCSLSFALRYCAISSKWRELSMPFAYERILFHGYTSKNMHKIASKWDSNIALYTTGKLQKLAKKVEFCLLDDVVDFAVFLKPLLNTINVDAVECSNEQVLIGFAEKFPKISDLYVNFETARDTTQLFTLQLIDAFYPHIWELHLQLAFSMAPGYFPPNLRYLSYTFTRSTQYPLLKFSNPSKLQHLYMYQVFYDFSWQYVVDSPMVFTNLKTLSLKFVHHTDSYGISGHVLPAKGMQLYFPELITLTIIKENGCDGLLFNPLTIPSHMDWVYLDIDLDELNIFSKLPIRSIGKLTVCLDLCHVENMDMFYKTTNRMLGEMSNLRGATRLKLKGGFSKVDVKLIKWANVTDLELENIGASALLGLVSKLPLLRKIGVLSPIPSDLRNLTVPTQPNNPTLTYVAINQLMGQKNPLHDEMKCQ